MDESAEYSLDSRCGVECVLAEALNMPSIEVCGWWSLSGCARHAAGACSWGAGCLSAGCLSAGCQSHPNVLE
eukprot:1486233-Amphidinium_carterae.1